MSHQMSETIVKLVDMTNYYRDNKDIGGIKLMGPLSAILLSAANAPRLELAVQPMRDALELAEHIVTLYSFYDTREKPMWTRAVSMKTMIETKLYAIEWMAKQEKKRMVSEPPKKSLFTKFLERVL